MGTFGNRLREAREQAGWRQLDLAQRTGIDRVTISRYEVGDREPSLGHAQALQTALDRAVPGVDLVSPLTMLGGSMGPSVQRRDFLRAAAVAPLSVLPMIDPERFGASSLDPHLLDDWEQLTGVYARLRASETPLTLLPKLDQHLRTMLARVDQRSGPPQLRQRLLSLIAGSSAIAAWSSLTADLRPHAAAHLDRGERIARELSDTETLSLILMLRADMVSGVSTGGLSGFPELARRYLDEAISLTSSTSPVSLRASFILRRAEEAAYAGETTTALRLLDEGEAVAESTTRPQTHLLRPIWTGWAAASFRGSAAQMLGRHDEAVALLSGIESQWPIHRPLLLADIGTAHARAGHLDEAAAALGDALDAALEVGHGSAGLRIAGTRQRFLCRWEREPVVQQLDERLARLV